MKISIITDVLNARDTIEQAILSVISQTYPDIEYIVVDGASRDGTLEIINKYKHKISQLISEPDRGHFEAMNKGIKIASGDIIGFLHADDFFINDKVIENIANTFKKNNIDCLWSDLLYVNKNNTDKIIRYWKSSSYRKGLFKKGWMPPHPTFFVKKWVYEKYGYFNNDLGVAGDYELMLRFLHKHKINGYYIPQVLVKMRLGGLSNRSLKHIVKKTRQDLQAWKLNDLKGALAAVFLKNISKILQFFLRQTS